LHSIEPTTGPVIGGTDVIIQGSGFRNGTVWCKFGDSDPVKGFSINEVRIITHQSIILTNFQQTMMNCTSPKMIDAGEVNVYISNNGQTFSENTLSFTFYGTFSFFFLPFYVF
jgi:hypothetical protein